MNYITLPNLPEKKVRKMICDSRISGIAENKLLDIGVELIKLPPHPCLYEAVASHPDMVLHHIGGNKIIYEPNTDKDVLYFLSDCGFNLIKGESIITSKYPYDIPYNVARVGSYAFHNTNYTDPVLSKLLKKSDVEFIHVKQGYSKCSISVINKDSIITMDRKIAEAAQSKGIDALYIEESNIVLKGLNSGFIGGSTGLVDKDKLIVSGDVKTLSSWTLIKKFLNCKGIQVLSLSKEDVVDLGSFIPLTTC